MQGEAADDGAALLDLAVARPAEALARATALLAGEPAAATRSYAHQAVGLVLRDAGDVSGAQRSLRAARRAAATAEQPQREADVLASLAVALVMAGRSAASRAAFAEAVRLAEGAVLTRVLIRRGSVLALLGEDAAAVADLTAAAEECQARGDGVWEARARLNSVDSFLALGQVEAADAAVVRAEQLFRAEGQDLEVAKALHNRGLVAFRAGRLPAALAHLAAAEAAYEALETHNPDLARERCDVLLAAGLAGEARAEVDAALAHDPAPSFRAELLAAGAAAALAAGDEGAARDRARAADRLFRRQGRATWAARSRFLALAAAPDVPVQRVAVVAAELSGSGVLEAPLAHLLAGRRALATGADPRAHLEAAAAGREHRPALGRASGELAVALLAEVEGRTSDVLRHCSRGLAALDEHRLSLGSPELRALAGSHGAELTELALATTLAHRGPRALLQVTERGRAGALALPAVAPPSDGDLARELAALRDVARRAEGDPSLAREREQRERAVRRLRHEAAGDGSVGTALDVAALLEVLGETALVELVAVRGELHALVVAAGRVRRTPVGPLAAALTEQAHAHAALRRAAHGRPPDLLKVGSRLQRAVLGDLRLPDGPVVVVPPSRLHSAPWGVLPVLAERPVSVVPSATLWLRARARPAPSPRTVGAVVLIGGPDLGTAGAELDALADLHAGATLLRGADATAEAALAALEGTGLAHVAAHGDFRADSPMFSSLRMADGPLTVHDLERLRQPPYRLVLSACDSGVAASVGGDDLLGLSTALLGLGTAGVLASCVPVNDAASVPVALAVHRALAGGADLAGALLAARQQADDPVVAATAASALPIGI